jgi:hypothetical protein
MADTTLKLYRVQWVDTDQIKFSRNLLIASNPVYSHSYTWQYYHESKTVTENVWPFVTTRKQELVTLTKMLQILFVSYVELLLETACDKVLFQFRRMFLRLLHYRSQL